MVTIGYAYPTLSIGTRSGYHHTTIMASVAHNTMESQRPCLPQFSAIRTTIAHHTINRLYRTSFLGILTRVYVSRTQIQQA